MKYFGTDGIRGIAGTELTAELALRVGEALGRLIVEEGGRRKVLIGTDTRGSADMLESALCAGLLSSGCDAVCLGVAPTPAVAYLAAKEQSVGVVISASHNPCEYNGIKVFGADGFKLSEAKEARIEELTDAPPFRSVSLGRRLTEPTMLEEYIEHLTACGGDLSGLRIGVDAANGATYAIAARVLTALGAECTVIGNAPDGININLYCGSTNTAALSSLVVKLGLHAGVAFDGDGDRLIAVDEHGGIVDGDTVLGILAARMVSEGRLKKNTVVGTVMTNAGLIKFLRGIGVDFISTPVGDKYVSVEMDRCGAILGGESSGHLILRDHATTGDGILSALMLLGELLHSGLPLSRLSAEIPKMPQVTVNLPADNEKKARLSGEDISLLLAEYERRRDCAGLLVRASGTEPCIRITVSAEDRETAESLAREIKDRLGTALDQANAP